MTNKKRNKKEMFKKILIISLYIIAIIILVIYGIAEAIPKFDLSGMDRVILLCSSCAFLYFGGFLLSKYRKDNKPMKINLCIFFILYVLLFVTLTLFSGFYGRNGFTFVKWNKELFNNYIHNSLNLIPFKTIIGYIMPFGNIPSKAVIVNIFGNIAACMPFGFFLPLLFEKQNRFKVFILTMMIIVLIIELLQFVTLSGSCDIDDLILNVLGAVMIFMILKIRIINDAINKLFLIS